MSITDELRKWAKTLTNWWYDPVKDEYTYTTGGMPTSIDAIRLDSNITAIADRIDAEHEKAMSRAGQLLADAEKDRDYNYANWQECKQKVLQGNITFDELNAKIEHLMDELPHCMDADNVPVSIGDRMEWVRYKDDDPTIVRIVSGIGNGVFFAWSDEQGCYAQYEAHAYRHYRAPTVEEVLTEFGIDWEHESDCEDRAALLKEYASKLRLAEGEDA